MQKKWIKLLISGRNGGSNFLHPPIGGRHRLLYFRTNIKATNMKEIQQGNLLMDERMMSACVGQNKSTWWIKTKQPIADSVLMSFCSTNRN